MFKAFDSIFGFLEILVDFVVNMFGNLAVVIAQISKGFVTLGIAAMHMPDLLKVFITAVVGYSVIINIIHLGD